MKQSGSGGGANVVHTQNPRSPIRSTAISPGAVSRIGNMVGVGTPYKSLNAGAGYNPPVGPSSNMDARPGGNGRDIHRAGQQGTWGATTSGQSRPSTPDIWKNFPGSKR